MGFLMKSHSLSGSDIMHYLFERDENDPHVSTCDELREQHMSSGVNMREQQHMYMKCIFRDFNLCEDDGCVFRYYDFKTIF